MLLSSVFAASAAVLMSAGLSHVLWLAGCKLGPTSLFHVVSRPWADQPGLVYMEKQRSKKERGSKQGQGWKPVNCHFCHILLQSKPKFERSDRLHLIIRGAAKSHCKEHGYKKSQELWPEKMNLNHFLCWGPLWKLGTFRWPSGGLEMVSHWLQNVFLHMCIKQHF